MMPAQPEERSHVPGRRSLRDRRFELACWYLAVLLPAVVFKLKLLNVRLDHQTSHVDLVPTLLDLRGVPCDSLLLHGQDMLDRGLGRRVIFPAGGGLYGATETAD